MTNPLSHPTNREMKCANCLFWEHGLREANEHGTWRTAAPEFEGREMKWGDCRRHAPAPQTSGPRHFPRTYQDDWCGDWQDGPLAPRE
jgi:hypothetical protein